MKSIDREKLEFLEKKGEELKQSQKNKEAFDVYQEILLLTKDGYGEESDEYRRVCLKMCELCNSISIVLLLKEKYDLCLMFLKKAESYCQRDPSFKAVTYNNYACYYRKTNKIRSAHMFLQNALELEWKSKKYENLADTYLNLCAVLSQLGRHSEALQNVLMSISILQDQFLNQQKPDRLNPDRASVLAIGFHNMGVELEFLKRYDESIAAYERAVNFASKHLGPEHELVENLREVLRGALETRDGAERRDTKHKEPTHDKLQRLKKTYAERPQTGKSANSKILHR